MQVSLPAVRKLVLCETSCQLLIAKQDSCRKLQRLRADEAGELRLLIRVQEVQCNCNGRAMRLLLVL